MVRMDGAEARKERISQIARKIQALLYENKEAGWIFLSKTTSAIMIETGLTKSKVLEYLKLLNDAGQFQIKENEDKIVREDQ